MRIRPSPAVLGIAPAAGLLAVLIWWAIQDGGYAPVIWLPGGLALIGVALVVLLAGPRRPPLSRAGMVAVAAFLGFVAWSALSVAWAESPGVAYEGALRTAIYALCFLVAVALPWSLRSASAAAIVYLVAVIVLGIVALIVASQVGTDDLDRRFLEARFGWPLGYPNANAALWTMAAVPALVLGSRRETMALLRPVLLAGSALLLDLALLGESRGWLLSLPVIALLTVVLVPNRVRLALFALPVAAAVALSAGPIVHVYQVAGQGSLAERQAVVAAIGPAADRIELVCVILLALCAVLVVIDRRIGVPASTARLAGRITLGIVVLAAAAGLVGGWVAVDGHPGRRIDRAWQDFKANRANQPGQSHFAAVGSTRYDFWRVGLNEIRAHPLVGLGQDNFSEAYLRSRRNPFEEPRWTHSLELRLLVHTGLVGLVLFALFLGGVLAAALGRGDRGRSAAGAALLLPALVWVVHGSVDWLWEYPVLTGTALAWAGAAVALGRGPSTGEPPAEPSRWARVGTARPTRLAIAATLLILLAIPTFAAFAGERLTDRASRGWAADPQAAFDDLRQAEQLQPLGARPALVAGLIALQTGDQARARSELDRAISRRPQDWFARFAAGLAATTRGDLKGAREHYRRALSANPREMVVITALRRLYSRGPLDLAGATRILEQRLTKRFGAARLREK